MAARKPIAVTPSGDVTAFQTGDYLDSPFGGTGQTAYALGDTLYSSATNTLTRLSGNTTTTRQFLSQTGTGSVSAAPTWSTLVNSDLPTTLVGPGTISATSYFIYPVNAAVAAAGTTQGTATLISATINSVNSGTGGVLLPGSTPGRRIVIFNDTSSTINVYPPTGSNVDFGTVNVAVTITASQQAEYICTSSTEWETLRTNSVAGSGINITPGMGNSTISSVDTLALVTGRGATTATSLTFTAGTASTSTTTGTLVITGGIGTSGAAYHGGLISTGAYFLDTVSVIAAAGTAQGTATPIVSSLIEVTSGTGGVLLPASTPGRRVVIFNDTTSTINVYPPTGSNVDLGSTNAAVTITASQQAEYICITSTLWETLRSNTVAGSGISITPGLGNTTIASIDTLALVTGRGATTATALTFTNTTASTSPTTGALVISGGVGISGNINVNGFIFPSLSASITATGSTQGTATTLTTDHNVIGAGAAATGVILPTPQLGQKMMIINRTSSSAAILIYPASGGAIDSNGTNTGVSLPFGNSITVLADTTTQWYSTQSGTNTSGGGAVTSVTGITGQIVASPTTGAVVLSLPSTITEALTFSAGVASSSTTTGTLIVTGGIGLSGSLYSAVSVTTGGTQATSTTTGASIITGGEGISGNSFVGGNTILSNSFAVTATGTNQGTAAAVTADNIVVATAATGTGIILPTPYVGQCMTIINRGANPVNIYPASGGQLDALGTNIAAVLPVGAAAIYLATSTTQWWYEGKSQINVQIVSNSASYYPTLVSSSTAGNQTIEIGTNLSFNPSTNILSSGGLTLTSTTTSSSYATGALVVGGGVGVAGNIYAEGSLNIAGYIYPSISTALAAAGTTQGTGTAIAAEHAIVTSGAAGTGVVLPTAVFGMKLIIVNRSSSAGSIFVYPATGAAIDSNATNAGVSLAYGGSITIIADTSTQWYSVTQTPPVSIRSVVTQTASIAQTTFTQSYTPGALDVYLNGSLLSPSDYTASNGTTVVLGSAARSGDILEFFTYTIATLASALALTGGTVSGVTTFSSGVASTSTTSGSVVISGGVGVSGAANIAGNITSAGVLQLTNSTASPSYGFGAVLISGGVSIGGALNTASTINAIGQIQANSGVASTSGGTGALIVSGGVGVSGALNVGTYITASNFYGRNRLINGSLRLDQINNGAAITPATTNTYLCDGINMPFTQASKLTTTAMFACPTAGNRPPSSQCLKITVAASYTVVASDYFTLSLPIEGYNVQDFFFGTANAASVSISFWVYSGVTGTFGASLCNTASTRAYPFNYTVSTANSWTQVSITIPGDTAGTWVTGNASAWTLRISLGCGTTYSGTANAWTGTVNAVQPTGSTSFVGQANGTAIYFTGIQLEKGGTPTQFELIPYQEELVRARRYYRKPFYGVGTGIGVFVGAANSTTSAYAFFQMNTEDMFTSAPTCLISGAFTAAPLSGGGTWGSVTFAGGAGTFYLHSTASVAGTAGANILFSASGTTSLILSALM
jgi:hypothetical protein